MIKNDASRRAYEIIYDRFYNIQSEVVQEFLSGNYPAGQPWKVVPAAKLERIWKNFTASGFVRNEKGLLDIQDRMIENLCRIEVNNIVSGHTQGKSESVLEDYFDEDDERVGELQEAFCDWLVDLPDGGWRISDYGTPKMFRPLALAVEADTAEERLVYLDMALNIVHQRSDLAAWFVEDGSRTLSGISGQGLTN
jgi:hypothetical protein